MTPEKSPTLPKGIVMLLKQLIGDKLAAQAEELSRALPTFANVIKAKMDAIESRLAAVEANQQEIIRLIGELGEKQNGNADNAFIGRPV